MIRNLFQFFGSRYRVVGAVATATSARGRQPAAATPAGGENTTTLSTPGNVNNVGQVVASQGDDDETVRAAATVEVTFKAETDCYFFTWPMERLVDHLTKTAPQLSAPLNSIVGSDVATKLFSQAKAGEGSSDKNFAAFDRRIYLPLDEPSLQEDVVAIIPGVDDDNQEEEEVEKEHEEEKDDGAAEDVLGVPTFQKKDPQMDKRSTLIAEKMWLERRGVEDTALDRRLAVLLRHRTSLNKYEISALLSKGRWRHILRKGTTLIREGETMTFLCFVLEGTLSVHKGDGDTICELHKILPEQMVGSLELLEIDTMHIAGETVTSMEAPVTYICWDIDELRALLAPRARLRAQLTTLIAMDLAAKFRQVQNMV